MSTESVDETSLLRSELSNMTKNMAENERSGPAENVRYLDTITSRKMQEAMRREIAGIPDTLSAWIAHYLQFAVVGVRSEAVAQKIALHLSRFQAFYLDAYGHDRISTCLKRDVVAWQHHLEAQGLAHATINNHLASLSAFTTSVGSHNDELSPAGDPHKRIAERRCTPPHTRSLSSDHE